MRTVFCPVERFLAIGSAEGNSNFGGRGTPAIIFINFWPIFVIFFAHSFPQGVIIVPKMPERSPINFNSTRTSDSGKTGS